MSSPSSSPVRPERAAVDAASLQVVLVGTYPPTECGIATHTANVRCALEDSGVRADVIRLLDPDIDAGPERDEIAAIWRRGAPSGLDNALLATYGADAVIVQHEFGIYPGPDGEDVIHFVEGCTRPILTVLHTVLPDPSARQRAILEGLAERSNLLVVHTQAACQRLLETHHFDPRKVAVVPHGASPNLHGAALVESAEPLLLTWGLLGPGKGIEHGIEAVALMRERGLDVRYLVAGETHPNVRAQHGERYRERLRAAAIRRNVADLIDFDDEYRDWDSLHALVRSASIVLVPYDSRDQVTSGVLVEALAAGKPVVSTAFPHAVELAASGAVRVVPHEAPEAIADAVQDILEHPSRREEMTAAARAEGARYNWSSIGRQLHSHLHDIVGNQNGLRNGAGLACS